MPDDFSIEVAFDELAAEDAGTPVVPADQAATDSGAPDDNAEATGEGAAEQGQQADEFAGWQAIIEGNPALAEKAKLLQGDYTRKTQELAAARKSFEAEQQQVAGFLRLQQMAQEDPAGAGALLQQYAAQLLGGAQAGQQQDPADPYSGVEPVTELERLLLEEARVNRQFRDQWTQQQQQQQAAERERAGLERLNAGYSQVEKQVGRQLSDQEKEQIAQFCLENEVNNIPAGYRLMNYDADMARAAQTARDQASAIVSQKAASPGAPSGLVARTPTTADKKTGRALIEHIWDELEAQGVT